MGSHWRAVSRSATQLNTCLRESLWLLYWGKKGYLGARAGKLENTIISILKLKRLEVVTHSRCIGKSLVSGCISSIESREFLTD